MIEFWFAAALLLLLAGAFAAWPLVRAGGSSVAAERRAINVSLYRQRVDEIAADRRSGALSDAEAAALTAELAGTLIDDDAAEEPGVATPPRRSIRAALLVALLVIVASAALYRQFGAYDALQLANAAQVLRGADAPPGAMTDLVQRLRAHLAAAPDDAESWYLLGHALLREDDAPGAVAAFERLVALTGDDPGALVALAQARFIAAGNIITAENRQLIQRILAVDPRQTIALEMLALEAFANADYVTAARHLENALTGGASGARAKSLQQGLARARAMAGDSGPALDVTVQLGAAARNLPASAALFVFAREPGQRMPLLAARRGVSGDVMTVRLDRSSAMLDTTTLAAGEVLDVGARLSASGNLTADAADLQVVQPAVQLGDGVVPVTLAFGAAGTAAADAPASAAAVVPQNSGPVVIPIDVAVAAGVDTAAPARVFVIARLPDGPPMPIAVRALDPATLPQTLQLTDADAMQSSRLLSMFDRVEVLARLSRSGNPMRQAGDLETAAQQIDPRAGSNITLLIGPQ